MERAPTEEQATSAWVRTLSREQLIAIRELHRIRLAWNLVALFFLALWAAAAWLILAAPHGLLRLPGYVAGAVAIHALGVLLHEGIHGNLTRSRKLDRWLGFVLGIPTLFIGFSAYRVTHLAHHRFNRTAEDPDEFSNLTRNRRLLSWAFYVWMVPGSLLYFLFHVPATALVRGTSRERVAVITEYALLAVLYAIFFSWAWQRGWLGTLLHAWILPVIGAVIWANFRAWAEHMLTLPGHPLTQTRTITSNRLVSFLFLNVNYHLEHHLFPAVPWYNLPKLHLLLRHEYEAAGAFMYKSYLRFLFDALRTGVHGLAPKRREVAI